MEMDIEKIKSKSGHACTDRAVNSLTIMCGKTNFHNYNSEKKVALPPVEIVS
jgi:hypothetical protein